GPDEGPEVAGRDPALRGPHGRMIPMVEGELQNASAPLLRRHHPADLRHRAPGRLLGEHVLSGLEREAHRLARQVVRQAHEDHVERGIFRHFAPAVVLTVPDAGDPDVAAARELALADAAQVAVAQDAGAVLHARPTFHATRAVTSARTEYTTTCWSSPIALSPATPHTTSVASMPTITATESPGSARTGAARSSHARS